MGSLVKGYFARQQVSNSDLFVPFYPSKKGGLEGFNRNVALSVLQSGKASSWIVYSLLED